MVGAALYGRPSFPRRGVPTECKGSFIGQRSAHVRLFFVLFSRRFFRQVTHRDIVRPL